MKPVPWKDKSLEDESLGISDRGCPFGLSGQSHVGPPPIAAGTIPIITSSAEKGFDAIVLDRHEQILRPSPFSWHPRRFSRPEGCACLEGAGLARRTVVAPAVGPGDCGVRILRGRDARISTMASVADFQRLSVSKDRLGRVYVPTQIESSQLSRGGCPKSRVPLRQVSYVSQPS